MSPGDNRLLNPASPSGDYEQRISRRTLVILLLILVFAAVMRFTHLDRAPVGGHGDVGWKGVSALDWLDYGVWPYYVWELYAPEPANVYLIGLGLAATGHVSYLAARLTSALFGLGLVVASFGAAYWLTYPCASLYRQRAGLLAALGAAASLHLMYISRLAMRAADFPTVVALLVWLTAWAWYRPARWPWRWALAGLVVAFSQYLYIPARLFPFLLLVWAVHGWWTDRPRMKVQWRGWFTLFFVAFLLSLPNIITFIRTPEAFSARADAGNATASTGGWIWQYDTSSYGGMIPLIIQKIGLALLSFGISWNAPYTVLSQPMLTPLFFAGLLVAVYLFFRYPKRIANVWPLVAVPLMLSTDLISGAILQLNALRQSGVLGSVYISAGIGLAAVWEWVEARFSRAAVKRLLGIGLAAAVLPSLVGLYLYLGVFIPEQIQDPITGVTTAQNDVDISNRINADPSRAYLMPYTEYIRPPIAFLTAESFRRRRSAIDASGMLAIPALPDELTVVLANDLYRIRLDGSTPPVMPDRWVLMVDGQTLLLPPFTPVQAQALAGTLAAAASDSIMDANAAEIARLYTIPTPPDLFAQRAVVDHVVDAIFNDEIRLLGYSISDSELAPGQEVYLTLYWQALGHRPSDNYELFVQIWDDQEKAAANFHSLPFAGMYTTPLWSPDEVVATHHWLKLPDTLTYGRYWLVTGFYRVLENTRLAVTGANADANAGIALIPDLRYAPPPPTDGGSQPDGTFIFGDTLQVVGLDGDTLVGSAQPGQTLSLDITWEALKAPAADYSVFLHLGVSSDVPPLAQSDALIGGQSFPTGIWRVGERARDHLQLILPDDLAPGSYTLWMGVYHWQTGERLEALMDGTTFSDRRLPLTTLQIDG